MNNISAKQNESRQIEFLLVQRALYSKAKIWFTWRISVALAIAIIGPLITSIRPALNVYVGVFSVIYLLLDLLVFEAIESNNRNNAAKIQELFDCTLFELTWNDVVAGEKPDPEIIAGMLETAANKDAAGLKDWYAIDVSRVDLGLGRFLCQRSNLWWDSTLRKFYVGLLVAALVVVGVAVTFFSLIGKLTVEKVILGAILPLLPFIEVTIKQIKGNLESAKRVGSLKIRVDAQIEKRMCGQRVPNAEIISRNIQDEIWRHRSNCPMIFDWVYNICKDRYEKQMQFSVKAKVDEYLSKH